MKQYTFLENLWKEPNHFLFYFLNFIQPWVIDLEICAYHLHNLNKYMENNLNFPPLVVRIEPLVLWCVFLYQRLVLWIQYQCLLKQIQIIHEYPICIHYSPKKNWGTTEIFFKKYYWFQVPACNIQTIWHVYNSWF